MMQLRSEERRNKQGRREGQSSSTEIFHLNDDSAIKQVFCGGGYLIDYSCWAIFNYLGYVMMKTEHFLVTLSESEISSYSAIVFPV